MTWISVKDSLPENEKAVLVCDINGANSYSYPYEFIDTCNIAFYCKSRNTWYLEHDFSIDQQDELQPYDYVTHWMPLPEAPNDDKINESRKIL